MNELWLQASGRGGSMISLLCAENPGIFALPDETGIIILRHPAPRHGMSFDVMAIHQRIKV